MSCLHLVYFSRFSRTWSSYNDDSTYGCLSNKFSFLSLYFALSFCFFFGAFLLIPIIFPSAIHFMMLHAHNNNNKSLLIFVAEAFGRISKLTTWNSFRTKKKRNDFLKILNWVWAIFHFLYCIFFCCWCSCSRRRWQRRKEILWKITSTMSNESGER